MLAFLMISSNCDIYFDAVVGINRPRTVFVGFDPIIGREKIHFRVAFKRQNGVAISPETAVVADDEAQAWIQGFSSAA